MRCGGGKATGETLKVLGLGVRGGAGGCNCAACHPGVLSGAGECVEVKVLTLARLRGVDFRYQSLIAFTSALH